MKQCDTCQQTRPVDQFTKCPTAIDGLAPWCVNCAHEYANKVHRAMEPRTRPNRQQSPPKPRPRPNLDKTCTECGGTPVVQAGRCRKHYNQYRYQEAKRRAAG